MLLECWTEPAGKLESSEEQAPEGAGEEQAPEGSGEEQHRRALARSRHRRALARSRHPEGAGEEQAPEGAGESRHRRALARSRHRRALARSRLRRALARSRHGGRWRGVGSGAGLQSIPVCHQQAQGHMSLGRWACGGWRTHVSRERPLTSRERRAYASRERPLTSRERRAGRAAGGRRKNPANGRPDQLRAAAALLHLFGSVNLSRSCCGKDTGDER